MPKKLNLNDLAVNSFVTTGAINGGEFIPNYTDHTCMYTAQKGCSDPMNTCMSGPSEYQTACESNNNNCESIQICNADTRVCKK